MPKKFLSLVLALIIASGAFAAETAQPPGGNEPWAGTWESQGGGWGSFILTQNGNTVTGTLSGGGQIFTGIVSGDILTGICDGSSINRYSYELMLTMFPDGSLFKIKYRDIGENRWYSSYNAVLKATGETKPPVSNNSIIGVWSTTYVPVAWFDTLYNANNASKYLEIIEMIANETTAGREVFIEVYRDDGTGYSLYRFTSMADPFIKGTYGYTSFNCRVEGDTMYRTNVVDTYYDSKLAGQAGDPSYSNKTVADYFRLYRIRINPDGRQQLTIKPQFETGTAEYQWTIDEYIEKGNPTWYTRLEK